jgi:hypothetical protein
MVRPLLLFSPLRERIQSNASTEAFQTAAKGTIRILASRRSATITIANRARIAVNGTVFDDQESPGED